MAKYKKKTSSRGKKKQKQKKSQMKGVHSHGGGWNRGFKIVPIKKKAGTRIANAAGTLLFNANPDGR